MNLLSLEFVDEKKNEMLIFFFLASTNCPQTLQIEFIILKLSDLRPNRQPIIREFLAKVFKLSNHDWSTEYCSL